MRKIVSKTHEAKSRKKKQYVVGGILVLIMVFSTIGFAFQGGYSKGGNQGNNQNILNFNGYDFAFSQQYGLWIATNGNLNFAFSHNPNEVERINTPINSIQSYHGLPLYVSSDNSNAEQEILRNLDPRVNNIVQRVQQACQEGEECEGDFPIKTCEDNFIIIREGDFPLLQQDNRCVYIQGPAEDLTKITNEFLFKLFGIV